jgi:hypothetical protein
MDLILLSLHLQLQRFITILAINLTFLGGPRQLAIFSKISITYTGAK